MQFYRDYNAIFIWRKAFIQCTEVFKDGYLPFFRDMLGNINYPSFVLLVPFELEWQDLIRSFLSWNCRAPYDHKILQPVWKTWSPRSLPYHVLNLCFIWAAIKAQVASPCMPIIMVVFEPVRALLFSVEEFFFY